MSKEPEHKSADGTDRKDHYGSGVQPWDLMKDIVVGQGTTLAEAFARGSAIKYLSRYDAKNRVDDLDKALWYVTELRKLVAERTTKVAVGPTPLVVLTPHGFPPIAPLVVGSIGAEVKD